MVIAKKATTGTTAASTVVKVIPTSDIDAFIGPEYIRRQEQWQLKQ